MTKLDWIEAKLTAYDQIGPNMTKLEWIEAKLREYDQIRQIELNWT